METLHIDKDIEELQNEPETKPVKKGDDKTFMIFISILIVCVIAFIVYMNNKDED